MYSETRDMWRVDKQVRYPTAQTGGLCLDFTAPRSTWRGAPLWFHCPTHRGVLTTHPSSLSMPNEERCSSTENILPDSGFSARTRRMFSCSRSRRRTVSLWRARVPKPTESILSQNRKTEMASLAGGTSFLMLPKQGTLCNIC